MNKKKKKKIRAFGANFFVVYYHAKFGSTATFTFGLRYGGMGGGVWLGVGVGGGGGGGAGGLEDSGLWGGGIYLLVGGTKIQN